MSQKLLQIDHEKCTGCRLCELVCAVRHHQVSNPAKSRIRVVKWEAEGVYVPMACQQCQDAPCAKACPAAAIRIDGGKAVIDRGEVWYDFPYDETGRPIAQPIARRPRLTLYVRHAGRLGRAQDVDEVLGVHFPVAVQGHFFGRGPHGFRDDGPDQFPVAVAHGSVAVADGRVAVPLPEPARVLLALALP